MRQDAFARRNDAAPDAGADYDALCATLMASAQGRAFLDEHARRARAADTALALEALTRLEAVLRQSREDAPPSAAVAAELRALLGAIAAARGNFGRFEGTVARTETVRALFDLLERRIGALIGDETIEEPVPANENVVIEAPPALELTEPVPALTIEPLAVAPLPPAIPEPVYEIPEELFVPFEGQPQAEAAPPPPAEPQPRGEIVAQIMALSPAERVALFS